MTARTHVCKHGGRAAMSAARYLYAVSRGLPTAALDGVPGLGGGRLEVVGVLDLEAAVSTVDLDEFGEDGLRANLESRDWVKRTARGHNRVVHACAAAAPTAPMRLATVCLDDESVRFRLEGRYGDVAAALDRVTGRDEWSVQVYGHPQETDAGEPPDPVAVAAAEAVDRELCALSVAARHLPPHDPRLPGHPGVALLNAAFLVDRVSAGSFAETVGDLVGAFPGVSIACAGPWPPYSFATLGAP